MKKIVFIFSLFLLALSSNAQNLTIDALRKEYYKVSTDSVSCAKLYAKVQKDQSTDNLILGYKGAITAAMANHVKNKSEKLKLFNEGKKQIEASIIEDTKNAELRFLRFTIQSNCPKALGYSDQISKDKTIILGNIDAIQNTALRKKMKGFLLESKNLTAEEKKQITTEK